MPGRLAVVGPRRTARGVPTTPATTASNASPASRPLAARRQPGQAAWGHAPPPGPASAARTSPGASCVLSGGQRSGRISLWAAPLGGRATGGIHGAEGIAPGPLAVG
eukprot:CAMPEP_0168410282 /NCGR_PEP_ID=MMETSP0228-20121227/27614_1 /TAXON_ID=133427 /ORGANISM="Protoceratium reticulatum, Strain CCCM 535 (=CCMP 1889)" /LENGTH=106 /DNA_ID=CAMNT_0008424011 /DNA_START=329 /DNA_END=646 /DNA_ORIENTATION=-